MLTRLSKLLILFCLWNVTFGLFPGFSADAGEVSSISAASDHNTISLVANSCEDSDCHQEQGCSDCHLGHCQFDSRVTNLVVPFVPTLSFMSETQFLFSSFSPSGLDEPPSV
ncbi:MAG: hypothetical protein AB7F43_08580 [Bacteriovoracia bacterium]